MIDEEAKTRDSIRRGSDLYESIMRQADAIWRFCGASPSTSNPCLLLLDRQMAQDLAAFCRSETVRPFVPGSTESGLFVHRLGALRVIIDPCPREGPTVIIEEPWLAREWADHVDRERRRPYPTRDE